MVEERAEELLFRDEALADEELPQGLARVVGPRGVDDSALEEDPLLDRAALQVKRTRLPSRGDPLQDLGEVHRPEVAAEAHVGAGPLGGQPRSQERSQYR